MAFKCCGIWSAEEFRMWAGCAAATVIVIGIFWSLFDVQVMLFYTSPLWATLCIFGPAFPANSHPRLLPTVSLLIFLMSTWWMQTLPRACRELWKEKMQFDDSWDAREMASALKRHRLELLPGVSSEEFDDWLLDHGLVDVREIEEKQQRLQQRRLDEEEVENEEVEQGSGEVKPSSHPDYSRDAGHWWNHFQSSVEAKLRAKGNVSHLDMPLKGHVDPFALRTYCLHHSEDEEATFPKTYVFFDPPEAWGPLIEKVLNTECEPWTCTFSEQHRTGRWAFFLVFFGIICAHALHSSWTCGCAMDVYLGCGKTRLWWIWIWAIFIPVWSTMYVSRIHNFNCVDFYSWTWRFLWVSLFKFNQLLMCLIALVAAAVAYSSRRSIYRTLGVDDHNILHWLNLSRSSLSSARTIQICVWRLDVCSEETVEEYRRWCDDPSESRALDFPAPPGGLFSWLSSNRGFERLAPRHTNRHVPFQRGSAPSFFVRIAWGNNEIQNSRVQRLPAPVDPEDVLYVQENFRMILESPNEDARLYLEVRDQQLFQNTDLGRTTLGVSQILHECRKEDEISAGFRKRGEQPRGGSVATEQIMRMLETSPHDASRLRPDEAENLRRRMFEAGFRPYELSEGGALWIAITELGPESKDVGCGLLGC